MVYSKDIWETGQQFIKNMREEREIQSWTDSDLSQYICSESPEMSYVDFDADPQLSKHCVRLDGRFSIAELDAIIIALVNDRGSMRA